MDTTSKTLVTAEIREDRLEEFAARLAKANKVAKKLGVPELTYQVTQETVRKVGVSKETKLPIFAGFVTIAVAGELPKLPGGWRLLGVVDHQTEIPIIREVPGETVPAQFRSADRTCDHCKKIRSRKETFVLQDLLGAQVRVGRQCVADFLGASNLKPENILAYLDGIRYLSEGLADDEGFGGGGSGSYESVRNILAASVVAIDTWGWTSKKVAYECEKQATASYASAVLYHKVTNTTPAGYAAELLSCRSRLDEEIVQIEVTAAIEWAKGLNQADTFEGNLVAIASSEYIGHKNFGIAVYLIAGYRKAQETLRRTEFERNNFLNEHFGVIGERIILELTLIGTKSIPTDFGVSTKCDFRDREGRSFIWWSSAGLPGETRDDLGPWVKDAFVKVKATIKKHDSWKDRNQTQINRVVLA